MATRVCIKVESLRKNGVNSLEEWLQNPDNVYVGRNCCYVKGADKSKWANPFPVKKYGLQECLNLYWQHVYSSGLINQINELRNKNLGCWCIPDLGINGTANCHVDVLIYILSVTPG